MLVGMALYIRLLVYVGLSLFIISGLYVYMVVCVVDAYNLTVTGRERFFSYTDGWGNLVPGYVLVGKAGTRGSWSIGPVNFGKKADIKDNFLDYIYVMVLLPIIRILSSHKNRPFCLLIFLFFNLWRYYFFRLLMLQYRTSSKPGWISSLKPCNS